jgi:hypothetical protein
MTGKLEDELRRVLADPPVPPAGVDDIGVDDIRGTLATLDRRVARVRARRRAAAGLSVAAVLAGGLAGATALVDGGRPGTGPSAASGAYRGAAQAPAPEAGPAVPKAPGSPPPPVVVAAARGAVAEVTGGTVSGPVRWVQAGGGYLVQIRFTAPVSCRYCHDPAASRIVLRGPVLEVQVAAPFPAATPLPSAPRGAGGDRSATPQSTTRLLLLEQATDLSRYGPVGEFTLPPR